ASHAQVTHSSPVDVFFAGPNPRLDNRSQPFITSSGLLPWRPATLRDRSLSGGFMRFPAKVFLALAILSLVPLPARAAESIASSGAPRPAGLPVHAMRVTKPIEVDGVLSEPEWSEATPESTFYDSDPYEGSRPSQRTEVRVLYDGSSIYIGARM